MWREPFAQCCKCGFAGWCFAQARGEHVLAARLREAPTREATLAALREWLAPHAAREDTKLHHHRTDFLLGLLTGLIVGILVMAVVRMLS